MSRNPSRTSYVIRVCALALLIHFFPPAGFGQGELSREGVDTLALPAVPSTTRLSHIFIIASSDSLILEGTGRILSRGTDYTIDYRYGLVSFDSLFLASVPAGERGGRGRILASYRYLPFRFKDQYARRSLRSLGPLPQDSIRIAQPQSEFDLDDIFGTNLQKSGSIVRGISVGSNRDFTVNSGLRLQLSGQIASDINVVASLTDENTPIQPEGTTQTLQEFDKVFVELQGSRFDVVLGDFTIDLQGSEFARLNRKLQGAKGNLMFGSPTSTSAGIVGSGAVPRGKFQTNQFPGIEGVQGPYRLTAQNSEGDIIVIAGTERVFVNGEQMTRGETNDYTIDYSLAEVTFTSRRLITAASRVTVDFEYTDRQFGRTFLAGQGSAGFWGERVRLGVSFIREGDNNDDPIDFVLSDSARAILSAAGDDRGKAFVSGVTEVDSNGFYIRIDTTVAGIATSFYRYDPGPQARYILSFSFVGAGKGDYSLKQAGVYVWKGVGGGEYLPVRFLPMPQMHTLADYTVTAVPVEDLTLTAELAQSSFDANTLSALDADDNNGLAADVRAAYAPRSVRVFGESIGSVDLTLHGRNIGRNFVTLDRVNEIEFSRKWGIDSLRTLDERLGEASLRYLPLPWLSAGGSLGSLRRGDAFKSDRRDVSLSSADTSLPRINYYLEKIDSRDNDAAQKSSWLRQKGFGDYTFWLLTPTIRFENERREIVGLSDEETQPGSFHFGLAAPGLRISGIGPLALSGEFEQRVDYLYFAQTRSVERESESFTQTYQAAVRGVEGFAMTTDLTLRNKDATPLFESAGTGDIRTVLVRNQTRYSPAARWFDIDAFYQVATQRSSALQRVFVKVTPGTGNYRYLGDLNNNGIADEAEFEQTRYDGDFVAVIVPSGGFLPVIDLQTSLRLGLRPANILRDEHGWFTAALSAISTETYYRIDENSTEEDLKQIYLLHLSHFLSDSTTISGSQLFTQDINILEQLALFSVRFRLLERKSLGRFSGGPERGYVREQSVRIRSQFLTDISQEISYIRKLDEAGGSDLSTRNRNILSNTLLFDLSYRPEQNLELGMEVELTTAEDRYPVSPTKANINSEELRVTYSFQALGQARLTAGRDEVVLPGAIGPVPFELTGGRVAGITWRWGTAFEYRVAQFVQTTVSYDGRSEAGKRTIHTAQAEVKAFF